MAAGAGMAVAGAAVTATAITDTFHALLASDFAERKASAKSHAFRSKSSKLPAAREPAVQAFFLKNGIDPERIAVRGHGGDHPIASNASAPGRRQNRRVEIVLPNGEADETVRSDRRVLP
jgi:hypothetical protein